jgi:hypothetical protein
MRGAFALLIVLCSILPAGGQNNAGKAYIIPNDALYHSSLSFDQLVRFWQSPDMRVSNKGPEFIPIANALNFLRDHTDKECESWIGLTPELSQQLITNRVGWGTWKDDSLSAFATPAFGVIIVRAGNTFYLTRKSGLYFLAGVGDEDHKTVIYSGNEVKILILLHEIAHLTEPVGFVDDSSDERNLSPKNDQAVIDHCLSTIRKAGQLPYPFQSQ